MSKSLGANIVGYALSGHDNNTFMFKADDPKLFRCPFCGHRTDFQPTNPDYIFKKSFKPLYVEGVYISKNWTAFAYTYDGQVIVNLPFKLFCETHGYGGLTFREFTNDPWHFHFIVNNIVKFDSVRNKTRFERLCPVCGNYEIVVGVVPFLEVKDPLPDGFYRSDLFYASGEEKHPVLVVGCETKKKLQEQDFKGLVFKPAYGLE